MAVCCQNLPLGVLSSCSMPSALVGALFTKFSPFLTTPSICSMTSITHSPQSIQTFSLTYFSLCHCIGMNEHCSILPTIGIVVFNILCFTALHYTAYKHALLQCPGLHQPILHNRVGQLAKCQRHLSTFSSYSKPVHWLYYSWKTQDVSYLHKMSHTYTCTANETETRCNQWTRKTIT